MAEKENNRESTALKRLPASDLAALENHWNPTGKPFFNRPMVRVLLSLPLLAIFAWLLSNFFTLRGFVNLAASRIDLALASLALAIYACIFAANIRKHRAPAAVVFVVLIVCSALWLDKTTMQPAHIQPAEPLPAVPLPRQIALRPLFEKPAAGEMRLAPNGPFIYRDNRSGKRSFFDGALLIDNEEQIYSLSFFIPKSSSSLAICEYLSHKPPIPYKDMESLLSQYDQGDFFERPTGPNLMAIRHPKFSGKVFIYHESELPLYQRAQIDKDFRGHNMVVEFRGFDYALAQSR